MVLTFVGFLLEEKSCLLFVFRRKDVDRRNCAGFRSGYASKEIWEVEGRGCVCVWMVFFFWNVSDEHVCLCVWFWMRF